MSKINPDMKMGELLETYPETAAVFKANGFPANTKEELLELLSPQLMLKTALKVKEMNETLFISLLEEKIAEIKCIGSFQESDKARGKADFLGYTYCPIKDIFKEAFERVLKAYLTESQDGDFQYFVPSGCGEDDPYEEIWKADTIEDFPDVTVAAGFGDFFRPEFVDKFVKKGYFKSVNYQQVHSTFSAVNYEDPQGWYTPYSVLPIVMLIDWKKLGNLPVPKQWSDLLNPIYHNNIIIGASQEDIYEDILLHTYKEYGDEGIIKLAANVKDGLHGAQMAKLAGTANSQGAAIYVIPWLFAKACPRVKETMIVWPADGAIITPMYLLVKAKQEKQLQPFIDFVMGAEYGQKSADNCFPVLNPHVDNKLPDNASFKWLGWDYIRDHSMEELKEHVIAVFKKVWRKNEEAS